MEYLNSLQKRVLMIKHTPWLERKFNFDYPVTHFPFFIERLYGTYPRLAEMTNGWGEEALARQHGNSWSVKQHIGHLSDLESLHEGRIDDFLKGVPELRAADMSNAKTEGAPHNQKSIGDLLMEFRESREHFISRLLPMDEKQLALIARHPRLQMPMRFVDMVYFVAEHDNHHLVLMRNSLDLQGVAS